MKTNLIIVEGLPGSGKSTTAAMIADELHKKGKKVICIDEGVREHPADYADYDFPDFETERVKILEKWRLFAEKFDRDTIYVFNCIFLQNPMCETMMIFGMDYAGSQNYISEISKIIKPYGMLLTSTQVDEKAQHFYRKLGYKDCGGFCVDIPEYEQPMEMFLIKAI